MKNRLLKIFIGFLVILLLSFQGNIQAAFSQETRYQQGVEAFKAKNYGSSELIFRKISEESGEYKDKAWYYLALSIFYQGNYDGAIFEFNRFLLVCTEPELAVNSRYWIAEAYYAKNNQIRAIEEYKRFITVAKNNQYVVPAHDRIGEIYFQQERYDEAIIEWLESIQRSPQKFQDSRRVLRLGEAYFYNNDYEKSLDILAPLIVAVDDEKLKGKAALIIGQIYINQQKYNDAIKILKQVNETLLTENPYHDAQYFRAIAEISLGDKLNAKNHLESFLLFAANSQWYYHAKYELGKLYLDSGKDAEGLKLLEEVRSSTDMMILRSKASLVLSQIYLKKDPAMAIPYLEDSLSLTSPEEQKKVLILLSSVYLDVGRYDDASRLLTFIQEKYPFAEESDYIYFLNARVQLGKNEIQNAIADFSKVEEVNPFSQYINESNYYLSKAYFLNKEYTESIKFANKYLKGSNVQNKSEINFILAKSYIKTGELKKAESMAALLMKSYSKGDKFIIDFSQFIQEAAAAGLNVEKYNNFILNNYPDSAEASAILKKKGNDLYTSGKFKEAINIYNKYLAIKPTDYDVIYNVILSVYNTKFYYDTIDLINKNSPYITDDEKRDNLKLLLGRSYYYIGNYKDSYQTLYKNDLTEYSKQDLLIVLVCALDIDDINSAKTIIDLLQSDKDIYATALYRFGQYYLLKNDYETAKNYFSSIIVEAPANELVDFARVEIASIFIEKERYNDAILILEPVNNKGIINRRNNLLIYTLLKKGDTAKGFDLAQKNLNSFGGHPSGEMTLQELLIIYSEKGDAVNFSKYEKILRKNYHGNDNFILYLQGKQYFEKGQYNNSINTFSKIILNNNKYTAIAYFYLATLNQFVLKKNDVAIKYYKSSLEPNENSLDQLSKDQSQINLAILSYEAGDVSTAKNILTVYTENNTNIKYKRIAENLLDYYNLK